MSPINQWYSQSEKHENTASTMASTSREDNPATAVQQPSKTMQNLAIKEKYIENYDFMYCAESSKYEKVAKIGQGTFGEVFKAREKNGTRKFVAMKKVLMENEKEGVSDWMLF